MGRDLAVLYHMRGGFARGENELTVYGLQLTVAVGNPEGFHEFTTKSLQFTVEEKTAARFQINRNPPQRILTTTVNS